MIYTQEHRELQRSIEHFVDKEINPYVDEWEDAQQVPSHELFKKMGDAGYLGIARPTEYGGLGLDFSYEVAFNEAFWGRTRCAGVTMAVGSQGIATPALAKYGSDELREEFLRPTIAGDVVAGLGVTEPGAGSDVASVKTFARKDGDDYVISGSKMWTTNGTQADWICLLANTSEAKDGKIHKNKSLICLPMKTKGVTVAKKLRKLGGWSSDTAQLYFDEVRIPQRYRIGEEGMGFIYQMEQFQEERLMAAALWTVMDRAIRETIDYTRERKAFGKSILDNQYVHYRLAELRTEVEALRAMAHEGIAKYVSGEEVTLQASMVKLKSGRLGREVADSCLQFWGGMGFMWESNISRIFRDMRLFSIGGGADEVVLGIISKHMGILPRR